ncbi:Mur ligase [Xylariaceae sp. FL0016]|nr:Mur ligase [Xylariaceae sp. FL0016]
MACSAHWISCPRRLSRSLGAFSTLITGYLKFVPRYGSTMARTYDDALAHLTLLQSNRTITSLFPPPTPSGAAKTKDLNALAIPEMLAWLERAGITQQSLESLRCIHVAGTKGKGSVCAYLTSILTQPGLSPIAGKVGTYTSPHLVSVRERIQLDGQPISQSLFTRYFFQVWDAFTDAGRLEAERQGKVVTHDELAGPATKPFYFRFLTILAFRVFLDERVRSAVVECGIGGEYDSTNVLPAKAVTASVVTQLGIDHVSMLGGTLEEIAWHKAGIAKPERKCFTRCLKGGEGTGAMDVIRRRAGEKNAVLVELDDDDVQVWGGVRCDSVRTVTLEGDFQKFNRALAVGASREHLEILKDDADTRRTSDIVHEVSEEIARGLQRAKLRGRCETREDDGVTWLIDGAHTAESLLEVAKWYVAKSKINTNSARVLVFNQQDRDATKLLSGFLEVVEKQAGPIFHRAIFTRNEPWGRADNEPPRDLAVQQDAADAMAAQYPSIATYVVDNVAGAASQVRSAASGCNGHVLVLVTGSLHLVGALLQCLEPDVDI